MYLPRFVQKETLNVLSFNGFSNVRSFKMASSQTKGSTVSWSNYCAISGRGFSHSLNGSVTSTRSISL